MTGILDEAKRRFSEEMSQDHCNIEPLIADQWIVSSLLQKSIRRGELEIAQRAALTLLEQKGSAIWRRLMVIAFEDVGAASIDAVSATVAVGLDAGWRKSRGGDAQAVIGLARMLADAAKDRSADYLICGIKDHPSMEAARQE